MINLVQNKNLVKKFWKQNFLVEIKNYGRKILGSKIFLGKKKVWVKKMFGHKKFLVQKYILGQKIFG